MRILSIDVGIKHLSYCMISTTNESTRVEEWDVVSVTDQKCTKIQVEQLTENVLEKLMELFPETTSVDTVLIENQPMLKNGMMKTVSVVIYTYFNMLKLQYGSINEVKFISASNKSKCKRVAELKDAIAPSSYKDRKKLSIELTRLYIKTICPEREAWFDAQRKKDDASDSFTQCIYYIEHVLRIQC